MRSFCSRDPTTELPPELMKSAVILSDSDDALALGPLLADNRYFETRFSYQPIKFDFETPLMTNGLSVAGLDEMCMLSS